MNAKYYLTSATSSTIIVAGTLKKGKETTMSPFDKNYSDTPDNRQLLLRYLQSYMVESSFVEFGSNKAGYLFAVLRNRADVDKVFLINFVQLEMGYINDEDTETWADWAWKIHDRFGSEE